MMRMLFRSSLSNAESSSQLPSPELEDGSSSGSSSPSGCSDVVDLDRYYHISEERARASEVVTPPSDNITISDDAERVAVSESPDSNQTLNYSSSDGCNNGAVAIQGDAASLEGNLPIISSSKDGTRDGIVISSKSNSEGNVESESDVEWSAKYVHGLQEGDHVIRWKMLGFCYPIQVHGIVLSAGPDIVTIVDCGLTSVNGLDKAGNSIDDEGSEKPKKQNNKGRSRLNVLTLVDEKEIKKWSKVGYGEEVQMRLQQSGEVKCDTESRNLDQTTHAPEISQQSTCGDDGSLTTKNQDSSDGLEGASMECLLDEFDEDDNANEALKPESDAHRLPTELNSSNASKSSSFWPFVSSKPPDAISPESESELGNIVGSIVSKPPKDPETKNEQKKNPPLRLPKSDPPVLVLARLRFLLEHGEESDTPSKNPDRDGNHKQSKSPLMPPHHLLYANSECIAVWCKTGHWSTLQASVFLHSSTLGNAKQTVTLAMFLSAQTVTVPASGIWGFFGGTTTVSLFSTQPWLVPALVGGGMVYVGLPLVLLWKAKGRWGETEKRLNDEFWGMVDSEVVVELIRCWSQLEC